MTKTHNYEGLRPAKKDDIRAGAKVWYKAKSKEETRWHMAIGGVVNVHDDMVGDAATFVQVLPYHPAMSIPVNPTHCRGRWVRLDSLWVAKPRIMFRVMKRTGEVKAFFLDEIRVASSGEELIQVYGEQDGGEGVLKSLLARSRKLKPEEKARAIALLTRITEITGEEYRIKTKR